MTTRMPRLYLIAALARNHVIGHQGALPWSLPRDWDHFREVTAGCPLIMGRSSAEVAEPLYGGTRNLILTSRDQVVVDWPHEIAPNLDAAIDRCRGYARAFVIGGERPFRDALSLADGLYLTHVEAEPPGDAFFPAFDPEAWQSSLILRHPADAAHSHAFEIRFWERKA